MGGREVGTPCERTERDETVSARWTAYPFGGKLGMRPHLHAGGARQGQEGGRQGVLNREARQRSAPCEIRGLMISLIYD